MDDKLPPYMTVEDLMRDPARFLAVHHAMHVLLVAALHRLGPTLSITQEEYEQMDPGGGIQLSRREGVYTATRVTTLNTAND